jgi:hypothetical protein
MSWQFGGTSVVSCVRGGLTQIRGAAQNERRGAYVSVPFSFGYFSFGEAKEK